jgi:methyltransferase
LSHPIKRRQRLSVAIPASFVSDIPHLREKTLRIGQIGRALAIFRVDEVRIYSDNMNQRHSPDLILIKDILSYMNTPQYLRKRFFKLKPELSYVGTLPPLRTPHHPTESHLDKVEIGEFRVGIVLQSIGDNALVDIGLDDPVRVKANLSIGTKVNVRILDKKERPSAALVTDEEIKIYWGYNVSASAMPLGKLMKESSADLVIATSRYGVPMKNIFEEIRDNWEKSSSVSILLGSPNEGLREMLSRENLKVEDVAQFIVNTIPEQGAQTVRTEEALAATLSVFNVMM